LNSSKKMGAVPAYDCGSIGAQNRAGDRNVCLLCSP
jgi:hypothetical protein